MPGHAHDETGRLHGALWMPPILVLTLAPASSAWSCNGPAEGLGRGQRPVDAVSYDRETEGIIKEPVDDPNEFLETAAHRLREELERHILAVYGPTVLDHWKNARNLGLLENPDGYARLQGTCGDTMDWLASNRTLIEALGAVSRRGILEFLGGLPETDVHCAELAAETPRRSLPTPWPTDALQGLRRLSLRPPGPLPDGAGRSI